MRLSKSAAEILRLQINGRLRVKATRSRNPLLGSQALDSILLVLGGAFSKLPSVSNSRMVRIDKRHALKQNTVGGLKSAIANLRPMSMKAPEYQHFETALSTAFEQVMPKGVALYDSPERRVFVLILLGSECDRMDSHNIPKFALDWLQHIGLLKNDRNADCLAIHKKNLWPNSARADTSLICATVLDAQKATILKDLICKITSTGQHESESS